MTRWCICDINLYTSCRWLRKYLTFIISIKNNILNRFENTVSKEEIAYPEQFLLLLRCFQKSSAVEASKYVFMWERLDYWPNMLFWELSALGCLKYHFDTSLKTLLDVPFKQYLKNKKKVCCRGFRNCVHKVKRS